jgi:hypothetical protein
MVQYSICDQESSDSRHKLNARQCSIGYFRMKRIAGRHVCATWGCDDLPGVCNQNRVMGCAEALEAIICDEGNEVVYGSKT